MSTPPTHEEQFLEFDEFHMHNTYNTSFNDFRDSEAAGLPHSDIQLDDLTFGELDLESKYRSIGVVQNANPLGYDLATQSAPPSMSKAGQGATVFRQEAPKASASAAARIEVVPSSSACTSTSNSGVKAKSSRPVTAPAEPFYVSPSTHFVTKLNVGDIKARVELELADQAGVSFEFFGAKCRWEGVFLAGSTRCKFEINVYKRASGDMVVEGNRLSGDSFAFINIYTGVRNMFVSPAEVVADSSRVRPLLPPPPRRVADPSELQQSLNAVLSMARSGVAEAQLSASQIMCNLASDSSKHNVMVSAGCVAALVSLVGVEFEACNQHAICALAHLSSSHSCQQVLMRDEAFLQTLLPLCCDANYNSIEMRRESARLLANISASGGEAGAQQVVACAGLRNVESWLQSVDGLQDERLRLHADRAKLSLEKCIATM